VHLSPYVSAAYTYLTAIFRFWEIILVPVQKKGLTRSAADDKVHLGTRKSVFSTLRFIIPSERVAVPESQAVTGDLPDLAGFPQDGSKLCLMVTHSNTVT
jgi:hypothetical protein